MTSRTDNDSSPASVAIESISALLDNEADELDLRRVLKQSEDDSVRATWKRFHLASALLRREQASVFADIDISKLVSAEIDLELSHSVQAAPKRRWLDLVAKSSIAATVALGLVVGVQQFSSSPATHSNGVRDTLVDAEAFVAPDLNSAVVPAGFDSPMLQARTVSTANQQTNAPLSTGVRAVPEKDSGEAMAANPELQAQFSRLMMIHAQQVSENSDLGVMSFARLTDLHALDGRRDVNERLPSVDQ